MAPETNVWEIISITDVSHCTQKNRIFAVSETLDGPPVEKH